MKKSKGKQVDLFYSSLDKTEPSKRKVGASTSHNLSVTHDVRTAKKNSRSKKTNSNNTKKSKKSNKKDSDTINLGNEIIIGMTPKKTNKKNMRTEKGRT